jgi:hypothetical protein
MGIQAKWSNLQRCTKIRKKLKSFLLSQALGASFPLIGCFWLAGWCNKISLIIPFFTANTANCQTVKTANFLNWRLKQFSVFS